MRAILVIPNILDRYVMRVQMERLGWRVWTVGDGQAAWHVINRERRPALVIVAFALRPMNGVQFLHRVAQVPHLAKRHHYLLVAHFPIPYEQAVQRICDELGAGLAAFPAREPDVQQMLAEWNKLPV